MAPRFFGWVRASHIDSMNYLSGQARHARRQSRSAEIRQGAVPGTRLVWTPPFRPGADPDDYRGTLKVLLEQKTIWTRGKRLGLHLLVGVTPAWVKEAGNLHDPKNPRNELLFREAVAWGTSIAGEGGVVGARLDLDEEGGAVVDLFVVPAFSLRRRGGRPGLEISTNRAYQVLQLAHGEKTGWAGLQSSWAAWASENMDSRIIRGETYFEKLMHAPPPIMRQLVAENNELKSQFKAVQSGDQPSNAVPAHADFFPADGVSEVQDAGLFQNMPVPEPIACPPISQEELQALAAGRALQARRLREADQLRDRLDRVSEKSTNAADVDGSIDPPDR